MDSTEGAVTPAQRHKARHFAMQAIYQWQLTGLSPTEIEKQYGFAPMAAKSDKFTSKDL